MNKTAILITIAFLAGCNGSDDPADPCDGVACSGHGTCSVQNEQPVCECDAGYRQDGLDCLLPPDFDLTILHTNDRHSHFLGMPNAEYDPSTTGDGTVGGIARMATLVEQERAANPDTLLFSAGDFSMGTLFTGAYNNAADLNFMTVLGYTAAALGNHEFDWGPGALADMIDAADQPLMPLLCANMKFSDDKPEDDALEALFGPYGEPGKAIHPYLIHETSAGIRVGVFGLMGLYAAFATRPEPVTFSNDMQEMIETAQAVVDMLRDEEEVDTVLALAHLGVKMDGDTPSYETIDLAKGVDGIDIILSGHEHRVMDQAIGIPCEVDGSAWTTLVMEAGSYGRYLGRYQLKRESGTVSSSGELLAVDDSLVASPTVNQWVDDLITDTEQSVLGDYPLVPEPGAHLDGDLFQVLTHSDFDLPRVQNDASCLGCLVADAMREAGGTEFAAVSNGGDIRSSLNLVNGDEIVLTEAFLVTPLGGGLDGRIGYPLVRAHLLLSEIKIGIEGATCDQGLTNNDYTILTSGLRVIYDSSRGQYDRIKQLIQYENLDESDPGTVLYDVDNGGWQVDQYTTLVSITVTSYIAELFSAVGLFPRRADGTQVIGSVEELIVRDQENNEVKLWYAFTGKLASFDPKIPDQYNPDENQNPLGHCWRRDWDLARHPE